MTFNEAEEFWRGELDAIKAESENGVARSMVSINMIETALKAFEARKEFEEHCNELRKKILELKAHEEPVALLVNYVNRYNMDEASTSFTVDNCKITVVAKRKGE